MSIVTVGDIHGKVDQFGQLVEKIGSDNLIIQVGDVGFGFGFIPHYSDNVCFIRGNHDDPAAAAIHPNYLGDYGYLHAKNTPTLFYLGGAWSIDYGWRQIYNLTHTNKVWWEDEELSQEELDKAFELYKDHKPEIVVSHEAPASIVPQVLVKAGLIFNPKDPMFSPEYEKYKEDSKFNRPEKLECIKTRTSEALQKMLDFHRPRYWIFGHYHISKYVDTGSTLFKCCAELEAWTVPGT